MSDHETIPVDISHARQVKLVECMIENYSDASKSIFMECNYDDIDEVKEALFATVLNEAVLETVVEHLTDVDNLEELCDGQE
jgi:hypothetical protein